MDVSTTPEFPERSCTPFGPAPSASMTGHRSSLETDESALRTLLIEQLKKKRVATPDEEKGMADEQKYLWVFRSFFSGDMFGYSPII